MSTLSETYMKEKMELTSAVKEELEKEKNKTKFELELDFNTRTQNLENELRRSMTAVREEVTVKTGKEREIDDLRNKLSSMTAKRQKAIMGLMQS